MRLCMALEEFVRRTWGDNSNMGPLKVTRSVALVIAFVFQLVLGSLGFLALYVVAALLSLAVSFVNNLSDRDRRALVVVSETAIVARRPGGAQTL